MIDLALTDLRAAKTRLARVRGLHEVVRALAKIEHDVEQRRRHEPSSEAR